MRFLTALTFITLVLLSISVEVYHSEKTNVVRIASEAYKVDYKLMMSIGYIESRLNTKAIHYNTNGTSDVGMFQINSIHRRTTCKEYNIFNSLGNAMCAAKILAGLKRYQLLDIHWFGRYHSKTHTKKLLYANKIRNAYEEIYSNANMYKRRLLTSQ